MKANGPHVIVSEYTTMRRGQCALTVVIVSCMDGRTDPFEVLDCIPREIISIRNPGCQVLPHLAALSAMDTFFGINQIIIIHHNDCGTNHFTVEEHINHIQSVTPDVTAEELAFVKHGSPCRKESEESVIEDLKLLRSTNLIRKELRENSLGLYYDVKTGLVHQVE